MKRLRAIDLYSGVGGWSLGLKLAGVDVVASYEIWDLANKTNFQNNGHKTHSVDIRELDLDSLPRNVDIVVGSPPCTQFSYSNRGGSGDIDDGLTDIAAFLRIVDHVRPKVWAMENVPRVEGVLRRELGKGGALEKFAHLDWDSAIVDMSDFGLPQRRRRCIAGNLDFTLLKSYATGRKSKSLGSIVRALAKETVRDPNYNLSMPRSSISDHIVELPLNEEEVRINRAAKRYHPIYNAMSFPDRMDMPVRTITATCTRVSRESVVIEDPLTKGTYRRLTVRERASLQGFPLSFALPMGSYAQRLRMVGNAVPPPFSYLVANAMQGRQKTEVKSLSLLAPRTVTPLEKSASMRDAVTDLPGRSFPSTRTFRFAIPSLRLKSGVRFELFNKANGAGDVRWRIAFYFGTSKSIQTLRMGPQVEDLIAASFTKAYWRSVGRLLDDLDAYLKTVDIKNLQAVWAHKGPGLTRPFMLLDRFDLAGNALSILLEKSGRGLSEIVDQIVDDQFGHIQPPGREKLRRNASVILAGLLVGGRANGFFRSQPQVRTFSPRKAKVG